MAKFISAPESAHSPAAYSFAEGQAQSLIEWVGTSGLPLAILAVGALVLLGLARTAFLAVLPDARVRRSPQRAPAAPTPAMPTQRTWTDAWYGSTRRSPPSKEQQRMETRARAMAAVEAADFETFPIMNRSEYRQFCAIERALMAAQGGYRIMAQVSLAELLRAKATDERAQSAASWELIARRLDFAVIDASGRLRIALEYQGHGHYQNAAFVRDAIKREAVRKSGADWMEIEADDPPEKTVQALWNRLALPGAPPR